MYLSSGRSTTVATTTEHVISVSRYVWVGGAEIFPSKKTFHRPLDTNQTRFGRTAPNRSGAQHLRQPRHDISDRWKARALLSILTIRERTHWRASNWSSQKASERIRICMKSAACANGLSSLPRLAISGCRDRRCQYRVLESVHIGFQPGPSLIR
jgi:hypothetical protein